MNKTIKKNILFVFLTISLFLIGGCSNNRSSELAQQLKEDGFYVAGYSKADNNFLGGYSLMNFTDSDAVAKSKDIGNGIYIGITYSKKSEEIDNIYFSDIAINRDEGNIYCVYGGYDNCFDESFSYEEKKIEIAAQPKMKKVFNKFLKKYDMTKEEFMDLLQYLYENHGKLE